MREKELVLLALETMGKSYAPYSNFNVGAALLCENGKVYLGCNIENAAFSPTVCAERTAFFKAISEGESKFEAIAIVGGKDKKAFDYCSPCGVCRQVMSEFCDESFKVILGKEGGSFIVKTLSELFPLSFGFKITKD